MNGVDGLYALFDGDAGMFCDGMFIIVHEYVFALLFDELIHVCLLYVCMV